MRCSHARIVVVCCGLLLVSTPAPSAADSVPGPPARAQRPPPPPELLEFLADFADPAPVRPRKGGEGALDSDMFQVLDMLEASHGEPDAPAPRR